MEITKFGLNNFRVFKEHFDFELSPIMVLTGPNNSGKSSLSKALLLLKENEEKINSDTHIDTELDYFKGDHDLGNHKYTINTIGKNSNFSFTFFLDYKFCIEFNNKGEFISDYKITTIDDELIIFQYDYIIHLNIRNILAYFKDRIVYARSNNNSHSKKFVLSNIRHGNFNTNKLSVNEIERIEEFIKYLENFGKNINFIGLDIFDRSYISYDEDDYVVKKPLSAEESLAREVFNRAIIEGEPEYIADLFEWQENLIFLFYKMTSIKLTRDEIHFLIPQSKSGFFSFSDLIYINTIKEPLKRSYSRNDNSKFHNIIKEHSGSLFSELDDPFAQKWLEEFDIGEKLTCGYDEKNDIYLLKVDNISLPEFGLGYGLIIHILISLIHEKKERRMFKENLRALEKSANDLMLRFPTTYIIEEPETGLHPAFQSKMAEMIVDAQRTFNINLIIETHSEYFIRKLQFLTATKEISPDDVIIYYFNNPKKIPSNEEQIKRITIDKNGSLSDTFGTGFIDEGTNIKFELLRSINRQQN